jgi:hypothetical protein
MTVGPSSVAALTDFVLRDENRLDMALLIVTMIAYPIAAAALAAGCKPMRDILDRG